VLGANNLKFMDLEAQPEQKILIFFVHYFAAEYNTSLDTCLN
jgi:hypothetical protein